MKAGAQRNGEVEAREEAGRLLTPLGEVLRLPNLQSLISCVVPSIGEQRQ